MSAKFSKCQTRFGKNHNAQHALLTMIENWKIYSNKRNKIAVFMDLSTVFDTLDHFLLIGKLEEYGFHSLSLEFIKNYPKNSKQRCKVNLFYYMKKNYIRCLTRFYIWILAS